MAGGSVNQQMSIPAGFELLDTNSPFNQKVGPYYCRMRGDAFVLGMEVAAKHCNSGGRIHGGMISALADVAIGHNIGLARVRELEQAPEPEGRKFATGVAGAPIATVSMSLDFVGTARVGDWVEVQVDVQRTGKSLAFANAYVICGKHRIARVSAVFKILR